MKKLSCIIGLYVFLIFLAFSVLYLGRSNVRRIYGNDYVFDSNISYNIEQCSIEEGVLTINGWCLVKGVSQYNNMHNKQVWLYSLEDECFFSISTNAVVRNDVTNYVSDGTDYSRSGIKAEVDISNLDEGKYQIYLCYRLNGMNHIVNTGCEINI